MTTESSPSSIRAYQFQLGVWAAGILFAGSLIASGLDWWLQRERMAPPSAGAAESSVVATASASVAPTSTPVASASDASAAATMAPAVAGPAQPAPSEMVAQAAASPAQGSAAKARPAASHAMNAPPAVSRADCLKRCVDRCKDDAECERGCAATCPR